MTGDLTVKSAADQIRAGKLSSSELATYFLDRIEAVDGEVNAFISVDRDKVMREAAEADEKMAKDPEAVKKLPLHGIPIPVKDLLAVKGEPLRCASQILKNFVSPYDATSVARLKAAGAITMGRLNMDEFAMGSSNENSSFGLTKNPWDTARVPGGSSGGSAAALRSGAVDLALGVDQGGR